MTCSGGIKLALQWKDSQDFNIKRGILGSTCFALLLHTIPIHQIISMKKTQEKNQEGNDKDCGTLLLVSISSSVERWGEKHSCVSTGSLHQHIL